MQMVVYLLMPSEVAVAVELTILDDQDSPLGAVAADPM
jgi:hypothetical protein